MRAAAYVNGVLLIAAVTLLAECARGPESTSRLAEGKNSDQAELYTPTSDPAKMAWERDLIYYFVSVETKWPKGHVPTPSERAAFSGFKELQTHIGDAGIESLVLGMDGFTGITSLPLVNQKVTNQAMIALSHPRSALTKLTSLSLSVSSVTDDGIKAMTRRDTGLRNLEVLFSTKKITDEGVFALARPESGIRRLRYLSLAGTHVTDTGIKSIAKPHSALARLQKLHLRATRITDEGLIALAAPNSALGELEELTLRSTAVTDEGVMVMCSRETGLQSLRWIDLRDTTVSDRGVEALRYRFSGIEVLR